MAHKDTFTASGQSSVPFTTNAPFYVRTIGTFTGSAQLKARKRYDYDGEYSAVGDPITTATTERCDHAGDWMDYIIDYTHTSGTCVVEMS